MLSIDNNANKQKSSLLWLWLVAAAVAVVVVLALGIFILIPLIYPSALPKDQMAQTLVEPPPPPPPPPPASSSPQAPAKVIVGPPTASHPSAHPKRVVLSSAAAASQLIQKSVPMYPPIARAARISGTVVLHAVISTSGSVINLQAVSGPAMLQQSALDAVKNWKYRPYLLNNQPVEFETTVNVIFSLGD